MGVIYLEKVVLNLDLAAKAFFVISIVLMSQKPVNLDVIILINYVLDQVLFIIHLFNT